jgi:hypothetical protein
VDDIHTGMDAITGIKSYIPTVKSQPKFGGNSGNIHIQDIVV